MLHRARRFKALVGFICLSLFGSAAFAGAHTANSRPFIIHPVTVTPATIEPGQALNFSASFTAHENVSGYHVGFLFFQKGSTDPVNKVIWNTGINFQADKAVVESSSWTIPAGMAPGTYTVDIDVWDADWIWVQKRTKSFVVSSIAVNGSCGASNGASLASAPSTSLCSTGTASSVGGVGPWNWSCVGPSGGWIASCSALVLAPKSCTDTNGGTHASGSTYALTVSQTLGSIAATTTQCPYGGTQPTTTTATQTYLCSNGSQTAQGSPTSTTANSGVASCNAPAACGSTANGATVIKTVSTTSGSIAATLAECAYGGTQPTTTTVTQVELCTSGTLVNQGSQISTTVNSGVASCNAPAACGSTANGATVIKTVSTTPGSIAATLAECTYGGTQPTTTTVTQVELCTSGTLANQGTPISTTVNSGVAACNAPAACGSTPSGSTVTQTVTMTSGSKAATSAQCSYGGTQPTTTAVTQAQLCTNGTLADQGAPVTTTVASSNPVCNPAPVAGLCGTSQGTCVTGSVTNVTDMGGAVTWTCEGINGGNPASCSEAATALAPPAGYTSADLLFDDQFTEASLNTKYWNPEMGDDHYGPWYDQLSLPYTGVCCQYTEDFYNPSSYSANSANIGTNNLQGGSGLTITATPNTHFSSTVSGMSWASASISSFSKATSPNGTPYMHIPAAGGYVQFLAVMPDSTNGAWGALWFLSSVTGVGEIDLIETGYTECGMPNLCMASNYHVGGTQKFINVYPYVQSGTDMSNSWNVYGLQIIPTSDSTPGSITMYFNGNQVAQYINGVDGVSIPSTMEYEVIALMDMANSATSAWHTVTPSGTYPAANPAMQIRDVQIYSLPQ